MTWKDKKNELAIDYVLVNYQIEKLQTKMWKNEDIDLSDHGMIGIALEKLGKVKKQSWWKEKWNMKNVVGQYSVKKWNRPYVETQSGKI